MARTQVLRLCLAACVSVCAASWIAGTHEWISGSPGAFSLEARYFPVGGGAPHDPSVHWTYGPGSHWHTYQKPKEFVAVSRSDGAEGVVWPDAVTRIVYMTWFASDLLSSESTKILTPASSEDQLYAATSNGQSSIILITAENPSSTPGDVPTTPGTVRVVKIDSTTGAEVHRVNLDTGSGELNFWIKFSSAASATWDPVTDTVAVMFSRKMLQSSDGLNHQGCIAFLLDGTSLQIKANLGQTSGHSWSNTVILGSDGNFIGLDLGDNFPRGVNAHRIQQTNMESKVVYTFKTSHMPTTRAACDGYDLYYTDAGTGVSYCKRSNDNKVYTEIGHPGIVEVDDGMLVFFAGEQPPLDNTKIGDYVNAPRDLGFVKVSKDLQTIMSPGDQETGGFYQYNGQWSSQTNAGINFITSSTSVDESVSRLKTFKLAANRILLTFEVWTRSEFVRTEFMVVDATGAVLTNRWQTGFPMRLAIADDGAVIGGKAIAYAGTSEGSIVRYEICADASCSGSGGGAILAPSCGGNTGMCCPKSYTCMKPRGGTVERCVGSADQITAAIACSSPSPATTSLLSRRRRARRRRDRRRRNRRRSRRRIWR